MFAPAVVVLDQAIVAIGQRRYGASNTGPAIQAPEDFAAYVPTLGSVEALLAGKSANDIGQIVFARVGELAALRNDVRARLSADAFSRWYDRLSSVTRPQVVWSSSQIGRFVDAKFRIDPDASYVSTVGGQTIEDLSTTRAKHLLAEFDAAAWNYAAGAPTPAEAAGDLLQIRCLMDVMQRILVADTAAKIAKSSLPRALALYRTEADMWIPPSPQSLLPDRYLPVGRMNHQAHHSKPPSYHTGCLLYDRERWRQAWGYPLLEADDDAMHAVVHRELLKDVERDLLLAFGLDVLTLAQDGVPEEMIVRDIPDQAAFRKANFAASGTEGYDRIVDVDHSESTRRSVTTADQHGLSEWPAFTTTGAWYRYVPKDPVDYAAHVLADALAWMNRLEKDDKRASAASPGTSFLGFSRPLPDLLVYLLFCQRPKPWKAQYFLVKALMAADRLNAALRAKIPDALRADFPKVLQQEKAKPKEQRYLRIENWQALYAPFLDQPEHWELLEGFLRTIGTSWSWHGDVRNNLLRYDALHSYFRAVFA